MKKKTKITSLNHGKRYNWWQNNNNTVNKAKVQEMFYRVILPDNYELKSLQHRYYRKDELLKVWTKVAAPCNKTKPWQKKRNTKHSVRRRQEVGRSHRTVEIDGQDLLVNTTDLLPLKKTGANACAGGARTHLMGTKSHYAFVLDTSRRKSAKRMDFK